MTLSFHSLACLVITTAMWPETWNRMSLVQVQPNLTENSGRCLAGYLQACTLVTTRLLLLVKRVVLPFHSFLAPGCSIISSLYTESRSIAMDGLRNNAKLLASETLFEYGGFILKRVWWQPDSGKEKETVILYRNRQSTLAAQIAIAIPTYIIDNKEHLVLVRQFRPATARGDRGGYSIAFPTGKIEREDNSISIAAIREVNGETHFRFLPIGFPETDSIDDRSIAYSSDGCLDETYKMVFGIAKPKNGALITELPNHIRIISGSARCMDAYGVETIIVQPKDLLRDLRTLQKAGNAVDGRLMSFAMGLEYYRRLEGRESSKSGHTKWRSRLKLWAVRWMQCLGLNIKRSYVVN